MPEQHPFNLRLPLPTFEIIDAISYIRGFRREANYSFARESVEEALDALPEPLNLRAVSQSVKKRQHYIRLSEERAELLRDEAGQRGIGTGTLACQIVEFRAIEFVKEVPEVHKLIATRAKARRRLGLG